MIDKSVFLKGIYLLKTAGLVNQDEFSDEKIECWLNLLSDLTDKQFEISVNKIARNSRFFPTVGEIRQNAGIGDNDKALIAWMQVLAKLQTDSYYGSPVFDDPVISHVIDSMGGWMTFSTNMTIDNEHFKERDFRERYSVLKNTVTESTPLVGFFQESNTTKGFIKGGNEQRALRLVKGKKKDKIDL